jgi:hypothetical protein
MSKTLWILTEERPKKEVVGQILNKFIKGQSIAVFFDTLRIIPILNESFLFNKKKATPTQVIKYSNFVRVYFVLSRELITEQWSEKE